ncbi:ankyrin repeat domain-containing protein [Treponema sp. OMZ 840]|uniref:ankyrin repeat domain-containing protein n=1 Tax=Treponema sp. OMZ 840 TaxID=244313 RepID=UPI003D8C287B
MGQIIGMELLVMRYNKGNVFFLIIYFFYTILLMSCRVKNPTLKEYSDFYNGIFYGRYEVVEKLLKKYPNLVYWEFNFGGYQGDTLITATIAGDSKMIGLLLKAGADPEYYTAKGITSLMIAAEKGFEEIAIQLTNAGADVEKKDRDGNTALHYLVMNGNVKIAGLLIPLMENIDEPNYYGATPLAIALSQHNNEIAFYLIDAGADLEKALAFIPHIISEFVINDNREMLDYLWKEQLIEPYTIVTGEYAMFEGNNLFHYACRYNNINFVKELLERGLWDHTSNPDGDTPLDLAKKFGYQEIIHLVEKAGLGK